MDIKVQGASPAEWKADCVILLAFEDEKPEACAPGLWEAFPWLGIAPAAGDFKGKKKELLTLYGFPELSVPRVMLAGLGKKDKAVLQDLRMAVAVAVKECSGRDYGTVALVAENLNVVARSMESSLEVVTQEGVVASKLALYRCDAYKGKKKDSSCDDKSSAPRWLSVLAADKESAEQLLVPAREAEAEAEGVLMSQNLVNGPANYVTPDMLAEEARKMAKQHGFACTVYSGKEARDMGMGAFWAVAQGAEQEGRFIILEYAPKGKEKDDPFVVVGKGITFDTGGISLKPSAKMHEMKGDMAGAAGVLGFFHAIGNMPEKENLPRIIGIVAATENMPGGNATRPGDVITTLSGQTVEILNTDAEGRLVLCDALTYAQQNWKPKALVDIATLTGACVIALGDDGVAVFTENRQLRKATLDAAEELGELYWPLPLWDAYDKNLDSDVADMANIGPREGGTLHAALFLRRFVEKDVPWMHLDIAGPGYVVKPTPLHPVPGGTGEGVRMFCRLAKKLG